MFGVMTWLWLQGEAVWHQIAQDNLQPLAKLLMSPQAQLNIRSHQVSRKLDHPF